MNPDESLDPDSADRLAEEALDFKMTFQGYLTAATEQPLDRLGSLGGALPSLPNSTGD